MSNQNSHEKNERGHETIQESDIPNEVATKDQVADAVLSLAEGKTVAVAESCTSGRVATALACIDNAVDTFGGGIVAYQEAIKRSILGVTTESVFSEQAAEEMARGARALFRSQVTVATTGVAGDEAVDGVGPGTMFIATTSSKRSPHQTNGPTQESSNYLKRPRNPSCRNLA